MRRLGPWIALALVLLAVLLWAAGEGVGASGDELVPEVPSSVQAALEREGDAFLETRPASEPKRTKAVEARAADDGQPLPTEMTGLVRDAATRQPVAGAHVELLHRDGDAFYHFDVDYGTRTERLAETTSDAQGRFHFAVARAVPHRVRVEARGFAARTVPECTGGSFVVVELTHGCSLTGVVRCEGEPVAGADLRVAALGETDDLAVTSTDASGAFQFSGLPAIEGYVQASSPRHSVQWVEIDLFGAERRHLDIELAKGSSLRGRVLDAISGRPVVGARVSDSWSMERSVHTDVEGRFVLDGIEASPMLTVHVHADSFASSSVLVGASLGDELVVRLEGGGDVRGRVVDIDGRPVPSAYVCVCTGSNSAAGIFGFDWIPARVESNGTFVASRLSSGQQYWLMARADGLGMRAYLLPPVVADGSVSEVGDVVLRPAAILEGRVLDQEGNPMAGIEVRARGRNGDAFALRADAVIGDADLPFETRCVHTNSAGRFRFSGLAGAEWSVWCVGSRPGTPVRQSVTLLDGEVREGLEFVLPTGPSIAGSVTAADGKPFTGWVRLVAVGEGPREGQRSIAKVESDGRFRFLDLEPGSYTIGLQTGPKGHVLTPVQHVAAGKVDLRLSCEAASIVAGKVLDTGGQPLRAIVYAWFEGIPGVAVSELCEADGSFRLAVPAAFVGVVVALPVDGPQTMAAREQGVREANVTAGRMDLVLRWKGPTAGK